jgi:hypothetical protein
MGTRCLATDATDGPGGPWPQGFGAPFDAVPALIAVGAAVLPFRFKAGEIPSLAACALLNLDISLMR